jgi:hypothetical protein
MKKLTQADSGNRVYDHAIKANVVDVEVESILSKVLTIKEYTHKAEPPEFKLPLKYAFDELVKQHNELTIKANNQISVLQQENNAIVERWRESEKNHAVDLREAESKYLIEKKAYTKLNDMMKDKNKEISKIIATHNKEKRGWEIERDSLLRELVRLRELIDEKGIEDAKKTCKTSRFRRA